MVRESQKRASAKYNREKMIQKSIRFSPHELDLVEWLDGKDNCAGYVKGLIRADMEGRVVDKARTYRFETANSGECRITIVGDYVDGMKDVAVECGDLYREFDEADGGSCDEIFEWLIDNGVEFESNRSLWFNFHYAAEMIDGELDVNRLLDEAAAMSSDELSDWVDFRFN